MLILPQLLNDNELAQARAILATAPWADGRVGAGSQAAQAKNNEQLPPDCDAARAVGQLVLQALDRSPQFLAAALPRKVFPPRINRYGGGTNYYGKHVDGAIRFVEGGVRVRTDISCTVFLSDPADYDGGELTVYEAGTTRQIKLPAGHAVLYSGSHVHEVTPVTRGARLAAFFWIESMVRSDAQRRLLHEFDLALTDPARNLGRKRHHGRADRDVSQPAADVGRHLNLSRTSTVPWLLQMRPIRIYNQATSSTSQPEPLPCHDRLRLQPHFRPRNRPPCPRRHGLQRHPAGAGRGHAVRPMRKLRPRSGGPVQRHRAGSRHPARLLHHGRQSMDFATGLAASLILVLISTWWVLRPPLH